MSLETAISRYYITANLIKHDLDAEDDRITKMTNDVSTMQNQITMIKSLLSLDKFHDIITVDKVKINQLEDEKCTLEKQIDRTKLKELRTSYANANKILYDKLISINDLYMIFNDLSHSGYTSNNEVDRIINSLRENTFVDEDTYKKYLKVLTDKDINSAGYFIKTKISNIFNEQIILCGINDQQCHCCESQMILDKRLEDFYIYNDLDSKYCLVHAFIKKYNDFDKYCCSTWHRYSCECRCCR